MKYCQVANYQVSEWEKPCPLKTVGIYFNLMDIKHAIHMEICFTAMGGQGWQVP